MITKRSGVLLYAIMLAIMLGLMALATGAIAEDEEKKGYKELASPQPTATGDKIEVIEFFWYGCPHCYSFEPYLKQWQQQKPDYIEFVRVPAVLSKDWLAHARAYYTAEELGFVEEIHLPLFEEIHTRKKRIFSQAALRDFFVDQGVVEGREFDRVYASEVVEKKLRAAFKAAKNYQITGVPSLIINGKYITSSRLAGSFREAIEVTNELAEKEYAAQNSP